MVGETAETCVMSDLISIVDRVAHDAPKAAGELLALVYPNWFSPNLHEFWGYREKLPFDQHWFLALCAPRPFLALEGETDTISLPEAVRQSFLGAQPAYELFGAKERLGVNYAHHGHAFTQEDWDAMLDLRTSMFLARRWTAPSTGFPRKRNWMFCVLGDEST